MFVTNTEHLIPQNVKHFWSFVKNLKSDSNLPSEMTYNQQTVTDSQDIANAFASHFQTCYSDHTDVVVASVHPVNFATILSSHNFTDTEISNKLSNLDVSKKAGPDGIPALFLKNCCTSLTGPLRVLFQQSMNSGTFPSVWKVSILQPIFKSGDRAAVENYRGISLLSAIPKLFESIVTDELFNVFKNCIIVEQHGFYRGRSAVTNLAVYQESLVSSVEVYRQVDAIYTDLSKAFDSVCHSLLIKKLSEIGVTGSYLRWIESYLSDRRQHVNICGSSSHEVLVSSGVPQGSHMGPVLFSLFINDVISCFKSSHCLLYADDLKFYSVVYPGTNCLQDDLNSFVTWCNKNFLKINIAKCKSISFHKCVQPIVQTYSIDHINIERVKSVNDLGVIFSSDLSFNLHIDNIVLKSSRLLGFIKRNTKHISDTKALICLYNCLVRSTLEYCSVIWTPRYACHINRLERVQNKFVKYLLYKFHFPYNDLPYETRLLLCGFKSLECRRRQAFLLLLYKIMNGLTDCDILLGAISISVPNRRTRHTHLFHERVHRTNYGQGAFVDRMAANYNRFFTDCDIFNINLLSLKRLLTCRL